MDYHINHRQPQDLYGKRTDCDGGWCRNRLPGRHYDILIQDDLVIADNAATDGQRVQIRDYYYSSLYLPWNSGKLFILGTRWHEQDLYEWLQNEDMKDNTLYYGCVRREWAIKMGVTVSLQKRCSSGDVQS